MKNYLTCALMLSLTLSVAGEEKITQNEKSLLGSAVIGVIKDQRGFSSGDFLYLPEGLVFFQRLPAVAVMNLDGNDMKIDLKKETGNLKQQVGASRVAMYEAPPYRIEVDWIRTKISKDPIGETATDDELNVFITVFKGEKFTKVKVRWEESGPD